MESPLPHIMEGADSEYSNKPKDRLVSLLDQIEMRVEKLRKDAARLEEEKDAMLTTLDTLRNNEMLIALAEGKLLLRFTTKSCISFYLESSRP